MEQNPYYGEQVAMLLDIRHTQRLNHTLHATGYDDGTHLGHLLICSICDNFCYG